jgi:hypothetical protein
VSAQISISAAPSYCRHRPEQTGLYALVAKHFPRFVEEIERSGGHLPKFVRREFEDYLKCGLLEHGFLRVKCDGCRNETWSLSTASAVAFAPVAAPAAWWNPPPTWSITYFPKRPCGNGC